MPVLKYPGDVSHMVGEVKGPTYFGEWLTAVTVEVAEDAASSRVTLAYGMRCQRCGGLLKAEEARQVGQLMEATASAGRLRAKAAHRVCLK